MWAPFPQIGGPRTKINPTPMIQRLVYVGTRQRAIVAFAVAAGRKYYL